MNTTNGSILYLQFFIYSEEVDTFDWAGYLLEGEDLNFLSHAVSRSSSIILFYVIGYFLSS